VALARLAAIPAAAALLAGCSSALPVPPPSPLPSGAAAYTCASLHGQLPDKVDGRTVTAVKPQNSFTNAWGDPAIILTCGVPRPAALGPASQLVVIDGVTWFPEKLSSGYRFTTTDRTVYVQVDVPSAYAPEGNALVDLAPVITEKVPTLPGSASPSAS
jgi:hypothetical protein